jgi:hypothetical protein
LVGWYDGPCFLFHLLQKNRPSTTSAISATPPTDAPIAAFAGVPRPPELAFVAGAVAELVGPASLVVLSDGVDEGDEIEVALVAGDDSIVDTNLKESVRFVAVDHTHLR